jgi:hypothetical protein
MGSRQAIIDTLAYSSIFSTPLTRDELYYFLHTDEEISKDAFNLLIKKLSHEIVQKDGYFTLLGQEKLIPMRKERKSLYEEKLMLAKRAAHILSHIPSIYFIGLTGSVAAGNPGEDDIDFFIVTKTGSLFLTRALAICLLSAFGVRRRRNSPEVRNKICLNMFCDREGMESFKERESIYVAREIAQMIPLFSRDSCYRDFLDTNKWVYGYISQAGQRFQAMSESKQSLFERIFDPLEFIIKYASKRFMNLHGSDSQTSLHTLFFYPKKRNNSIIQRYKKAGGLL